MTKQHNIAERSPWRWPAAAVALTVAAAHIPITAEHLSEAPYIGWSFVALEIAAVALAITLVLYDAGMVWRVAASLCAAALAAYMLTRTVALPQIGDDLGNWGEPLGVVALTAESMLVVLSLVRNWPMIRESRLGRHPAVVAAALLATGLTAIGCVSGRGEAMAGMESAGDGGSNSMSVSLPPLQWASFAHWHVRPWWVLFSVVALAGYLSAVVVARRQRQQVVHPARVTAFVAGILVLLFTVSSAIDSYAMALFWDHMIEHLLLIMVVPALLVLGSPITAVRAAAAPGRTAAGVDQFARSWPISVLTHPVVGFGLYAVVIVGTHLTDFMDAMASHRWLMEAEQWLYLITGFIYLLPLLGAEPIRWRLPYLGRFGLLLFGMIPDTLVGIVLMQSAHEMFPIMDGAHPAWAPSPVRDLHIGGALMWVGGDGLMMLFGIGVTVATITHTGSDLVIGSRLESIRRSTLAQRIIMAGGTAPFADDADVDDDEAALNAYNEMLARMNSRTTPSSEE